MSQPPMTVGELIEVLTSAESKVLNIGGTYWNAEVMPKVAACLKQRFQENHMADIMGDSSLKFNILEKLALDILCARVGVKIPGPSK